MATGETGFADVTFDCIPVKHHSVTWGRDDDLCVHDARTQARMDCGQPRDEDSVS
ncbi:hypothetical protein [Mycobacterium sp. 852002-10029_SCH5224772]|uniref:hypothetical protein n=1 Tax=Mycobacterium sp. 852002-10029_SCH5224772 TaxID=1834083 RepID=UPI000A663470|nr:hypothetical protein [Mycobacterium sp. 852002-10029_SCH5224772]